jgi:hypothetical protein
VASLGGKSVALPVDDLNMPFHNPSLLNPAMDRNMVLNYVGYFAGINYGYASYARDRGEKGTLAAGLHYVNYGEFIEADNLGYKTGTFRASEFALHLIISRRLDSLLTVGLTIKPVYSHLERYNSFGILADAGITYYDPASLFAAAFVIKNVGTQLIRYYKGDREKMPFEIQAGVSQKLMHAPFRFSLVIQHLQQPDMSYDSPVEENGETGSAEQHENTLEKIGDGIMRHMIIGVEFLPIDNFYFNFGYNYQRRQELKIPAKAGMAGFSWGFGMKIKKFHISYGRASYHIAGASDHFSLSMNLAEFYRPH